MQSLDLRVLEQAASWSRQGQPIWLCTVITTYGSAPRSPGALLVANRQGEALGSLSGGCIEDDFLQRIANNEFTQPSQRVRYGEGGNATQVTLPCGGAIDVLIEYLAPSVATQEYLTDMRKAADGDIPRIKRVDVPAIGQLLVPVEGRQYPAVQQYSQAEGQGCALVIRLQPAKRLLVAGLSNVAEYCINFARALGFEVIVCEHRQEELRRFSPLIASMDNVTLLEQFPAHYLEQNRCHAHTAIVALTHDPRIDDQTLMEACLTDAFYIGVMGSERSSEKRRDRLARVAGLDVTQLDRIHAPIGLAIGSKTPAEIALAILADIVCIKNGKSLG